MRGDYQNQVVGGVMSVWLQEVGWHAAKLGSELRAGDRLVYNYGSTGEIRAIERETAKSVFVSVFSDGKLYQNIKIGKNTYKPVVIKKGGNHETRK